MHFACAVFGQCRLIKRGEVVESLYLLIPVSVILVFAIGVAFWFSLRGGQYEDMEGPAYRVVMDDDLPPEGGEDASLKREPEEKTIDV